MKLPRLDSLYRVYCCQIDATMSLLGHYARPISPASNPNALVSMAYMQLGFSYCLHMISLRWVYNQKHGVVDTSTIKCNHYSDAKSMCDTG